MSKNNDGIYMTPEETIAEIEITQEVDKLWLLVEGKKDVIFFKSFQNDDFCDAEIIALGGWEGVILATMHFEKNDNRYVIGIVDNDYRTSSYRYPDNVISSDLHSLESMMFWSDAFQAAVTQAIPPQHIPQRNRKRFYDKIRKEILTCCLPLSKFRLYCFINCMNLSFKNLDHKKIVNKKLEFSDKITSRYLSSLNDNGSLFCISDWHKSQEFEFDARGYHDKLLYHGHDLIGFCVIILKNKYKSHKEIEDIESYFRSAFVVKLFFETEMYARIAKKLKK